MTTSKVHAIRNPSFTLQARRGVLCLVAVLMASVGLSAWLGLYQASTAAHEAAFSVAVDWQPWGGPAWIPAARKSLPELHDPVRRDRLLRRLDTRYPLASTLWLERARTASAGHESGAVIRRLLGAAVAVEPGDPEVRWQAAMIALQAGDESSAGDYMRQFISLNPRGIDRAVLVARRWLGESPQLLDTLAPDNPEALKHLLKFAANWQDWALADKVWERLPPAAAKNADIIADYVNRLLNAGHGRQAALAWKRVDGSFVAGEVSNGTFTQPLRQRSLFDWRIHPPEGATIERDEKEYVSAPASLHVHFDGKQNLRLDSPTQFVAVEPGRTYLFSGRWCARGLTTLALPYWYVVSRGPDKWSLLARIKPTSKNDWSWQEFTVTFTVPEGAEEIYIQLRRDPTSNFDRFIAGDLWIDDVKLKQF